MQFWQKSERAVPNNRRKRIFAIAVPNNTTRLICTCKLDLGPTVVKKKLHENIPEHWSKALDSLRILKQRQGAQMPYAWESMESRKHTRPSLVDPAKHVGQIMFLFCRFSFWDCFGFGLLIYFGLLLGSIWGPFGTTFSTLFSTSKHLQKRTQHEPGLASEREAR